MTGGTDEAAGLNRRLARAAAEHGVGARARLGPAAARRSRARCATYRAAGAERPPLLLANLGAAQVRGPHGPERAERLVELLDADGLSIHLNPLQEAVQPEGEPDFSGVLDGIAATVARLAPRPVVVKEVGFGLDGADVAALARRRRRGGRRRRRRRHELGAHRGAARRAGGRRGRRVRRLGTADGRGADGGARRGAGPAGDRLRRRCATASTPPSASRSAPPRPASRAPSCVAAQADRAGEAVATVVRAAADRGVGGRRARRPALGPEHLAHEGRGHRRRARRARAPRCGCRARARRDGGRAAPARPAAAPTGCATAASRGTRARR